jgi:hypothetical protein
MKKLILLGSLLLSLFSFGQSLTPKDIKEYIEATTKDLELPFELPGTGVIMQSMSSFGRNIIFTYEVPAGWQAYENTKEEIINSLSPKFKKFYFKEEINLIYIYSKNKNLVEEIIISYSDFETNTDLGLLGQYISYKSHSKSKGVNIKIKDPLSFEKLEGNRPNIVAKFNNKENNLVYLLQVNNLPTFVSRIDIEEEFSSATDVEEFAKDYLSGIDCNYISSKMIKVDRYPAIEVIYDLVIQVLDESYEARHVIWIVFYEDALVSLMGSSSKKDFRDNYYIFFKITNSVLFEDQYNSINNNYVGDNENFEIYVDKFYRELESAGIYKIRPEKVNIKLRPLDSFKNLNHLHGYSLGYNNDNEIDIHINRRSWNTFSKAQKYYLIFHELSHDVLNLDDLESNAPNENSIMYPSINAYKTLSMDDFIENFQQLIENY